MNSSPSDNLFSRRSFRSQYVVVVLLLVHSLPAVRAQQLNYTTPYSFTTLAGTASDGSVDGPARAARFYAPAGIAVDTSGNIYVADTANATIRKISPAGVVTTLAGKAGAPFVPHTNIDGTGAGAWFSDPVGLAVDSTGTIFVSGGDNSVRKITPAGVVTTLNGSLNGSELNVPEGVAPDPAGNLYIADTFHNAIRRSTVTGGASVLIAGGAFGSADGTGSAAQFYTPQGIVAGLAGEVYVADTGNHTIRKISSGGVVTTLAGVAGAEGSADGDGVAARFNFPTGLALDHTGNIYVADSGNSQIRKISPTGTVTTVAGQAGQDGHVDGAASSALFYRPQAVAFDPAGNLVVADTLNNTIRKITAAGVVSPLAGFSPSEARGDADGLGGAARFNGPTGICRDAAGSLFVADRYNNTVRKITTAGLVTTYAGGAGQDSAGKFTQPINLTMASSGSLYVTDLSSVWRIAPGGTTSLFFDGLAEPSGSGFDSKGNLIVADSGHFVLHNIAADGTDTILAGSRGQRGNVDGTGEAARFDDMGCLAVDASDNIFLSDYGNNTIRKITPSGVVTTFAGNSEFGSKDGPGNLAQFQRPWGLALNAAGNIFVTETGRAIRRITPAGVVSTVAGIPDFAGTVDEVGAKARFEGLGGITVDASGTLYVASGGPNASTVRVGRPAGAPVISAQPLSQTVALGDTVQFTVAARGEPAPTYQWYFNGGIFNGATTNTLSFASVRSTDAGDYTVVATNELGSVTSAKATLTFSPAPAGPSTPPPTASSGGGAIEGWFVWAILSLWFASRRRGKTNGAV